MAGPGRGMANKKRTLPSQGPRSGGRESKLEVVRWCAKCCDGELQGTVEMGAKHAKQGTYVLGSH